MFEKKIAAVQQQHQQQLHVVVVGINYAPEVTGIAPYTAGYCAYLSQLGARVEILTGVPHYPQWRVEPAYRRRLRTVELNDGVRVERLRHFVPTRQSAMSRGLYEATFGAHALARGWRRTPDVVVAVSPSLFGAAAGAVIGARRNVPFILWMQDMMGAATTQSGISGGSRVESLTRRLEIRTVRRAAAVVVASEQFQQHLCATGVSPDRVRVVPNWNQTHRQTCSRDAMRIALSWKPDEFIALHAGNMGLKQDLQNVVAAAALARRAAPLLRFVLMGDGSQRAALERAAVGLGNISFLPPCSNDEYPNVLAAADALLINERPTAVNMSLPSKLTSYFSAGRPVVAASVADGATGAELRRARAAVVVPPGCPDILVAQLHELSRDRNRQETLGRNAAEYARQNLDSRARLAELAEMTLSIGGTGGSR